MALSKTYNFPTQDTPSGQLSFQVVTSSGIGTETITEKYFSSSLKINNETELVGGDIKSASVDFTIDDDLNDLFYGTIINSLYAYNSWVTVRVSINSKDLFFGVIDKSTITSETYFATNSAGDGSKRKLSFRCKWVLELLKNISGEDVGNYILANPTYYRSLPQLIDSTFGGTLFKWISIINILKSLIAKLETDYGFSTSVFIEDIPITFFTKRSEPVAMDSKVPFSGFVFPPHYVGTAGSFINTYIGGIDSIGLNTSNCVGIPLMQSNGALFGYFNKEDDRLYQETAYDFMSSIIKSFGLFISVEHKKDIDLFIRIGSRSSGVPVILNNIIEQSEELFSDLQRNSVKVDAITDGNSYEKVINQGGSAFTGSCSFDFRNDIEFAGGHDSQKVANSEYSLSVPVKSSILGRDCLALIREVGVGNNKLVNPNFESTLDPWEVGSSAFFHSSIDFGFGNNSAYCDLLPTTENEIKQVVDNADNDDLIISTQALIHASGNVRVSFKFYYLDTTTVIYSSGITVDGSIIGNRAILLYALTRGSGGALLSSIGRVGISFAEQDGLSGAYVYIGNTKLFRHRLNCPELVGKTIENYFGNNSLTNKRYIADGIQSVRVCDYINTNNEKYFIKKVSWNISDNETEIEAINYPY